MWVLDGCQVVFIPQQHFEQVVMQVETVLLGLVVRKQVLVVGPMIAAAVFELVVPNVGFEGGCITCTRAGSTRPLEMEIEGKAYMLSP